MSDFMQPEIYEDSYYSVETNAGTEIVPCSAVGLYDTVTRGLLSDYCDGKIQDPQSPIKPDHGWICRLSASGYMDCTAWAAFPTEQECNDYLEMYGDE